MKIKHWAGYGSVQAKKISRDDDTLVVEVRGEHECGLERCDAYDIFNWLVKRFDKSRKNWFEIESFDISSRYEKKDGTYTGYEEICVYAIHFKGKHW